MLVPLTVAYEFSLTGVLGVKWLAVDGLGLTSLRSRIFIMKFTRKGRSTFNAGLFFRSAFTPICTANRSASYVRPLTNCLFR